MNPEPHYRSNANAVVDFRGDDWQPRDEFAKALAAVVARFLLRSAAEEQPRIGEEDFCMLRLHAVAGVGKYQKSGIAKVLFEDDGVD